MSGQLCLKWNNHSAAFDKLLNRIYLDDVYSDATILCHGKFYPVHRFVLSTCSEYFEEMFRQCVRLNNKHPFIIVKDVHPEQMEALLNYMYKGDVNVPQEMLPELIKAAETFKIRGLAVPDEEPTPKSSRKRSYTSISSPPSVPKKSKRHEEKSSVSNIIDTKSSRCDTDDSSSQLFQDLPKPIDEVPKSPTEPLIDKIKKEHIDKEEPIAIIDVDELESPIKKEQQDYETFVEDGASNELFDFDASNDQFDASNDQFDAGNGQFDGQQESGSWGDLQPYEAGSANENDETQRYPFGRRFPAPLLPSTGDYSNEPSTSNVKKCHFPSCNFETMTHSLFVHHMCTTHAGKKLSECPYCPYKSIDKSNMRKHIKSIHSSDRPFQCPHCTYNTSRKDSLKLHVARIHNLPL